MEKSESAYRTIGEAAEELDLPQHVLRFWETRFSQISPMKRSGGRRYYRPEDLELLAAIRHLLYGEGYTIKGVQRILKQQGARAIVDLVNQLKDGGAANMAAAAAANPSSPAAPMGSEGNEAPFAPAGPSGRDVPAPQPGLPSAMPPRLSADTAEKLKAVLGDLEACARVLETARSS
jgi:DNA-binding transcriptional MerR regulator